MQLDRTAVRPPRRQHVVRLLRDLHVKNLADAPFLEQRRARRLAAGGPVFAVHPNGSAVGRVGADDGDGPAPQPRAGGQRPLPNRRVARVHLLRNNRRVDDVRARLRVVRPVCNDGSQRPVVGHAGCLAQQAHTDVRRHPSKLAHLHARRGHLCASHLKLLHRGTAERRVRQVEFGQPAGARFLSQRCTVVGRQTCARQPKVANAGANRVANLLRKVERGRKGGRLRLHRPPGAIALDRPQVGSQRARGGRVQLRRRHVGDAEQLANLRHARVRQFRNVRQDPTSGRRDTLFVEGGQHVFGRVGSPVVPQVVHDDDGLARGGRAVVANAQRDPQFDHAPRRVKVAGGKDCQEDHGPVHVVHQLVQGKGGLGVPKGSVGWRQQRVQA
mmetsp:Transcript_5872/g.19175  ORF Transcript_5872/g.19175 Transcript_5872/m.19175 type:complete len:386 (-) Transcript_5872:380-1537(-)